ncbi:MAG: phytanoyl-CoA dioxygenase family protein [Acidimicrobiales bacterium]
MPLTIETRFAANDPELGRRVATAVDEAGCAIVTDVIDRARCDALVAEVRRVETEHHITVGTNDFEGFSTRRIFNLISKSPLFRELVIDDTMVPVVEAILGPGLLLSGTTSMNIGPDETPQLLHADDGMVTLPRPHPATMVTTLWALTDFRSDNGATHVVPGSHQAPTMPRPGDTHDVVPAEMSAGSVLVLHGSTWHGGGHNTTTDEHRYGLSIQYVAGWCRQQQNLMLGTDPDVVASYPRALQEMIGYSLFANVMGHVDRRHPLTLLGVEQEPDMVWDKMDRDS